MRKVIWAAALAMGFWGRSLMGAELKLPAPAGWPAPDPAPALPGPAYAPPIALEAALAADAPRIFEHSLDAGPDETFFASGSGLTRELYVWGNSEARPQGQAWTAKTQLAADGYLAATLPEQAYDGPFLVWAGKGSVYSRPIRLNVPQPQWCIPDRAHPRNAVRIFGRDLARRPDRTTAFVYLAQPGKPGQWLPVESAGKYALGVRLPDGIAPGEYQIWVHAGLGGAFAWGGPLQLTVTPRLAASAPAPVSLTVEQAKDLPLMADTLAAQGGGTIHLAAGVFPFRGTLRLAKGVAIVGAGMNATRLQLVSDPTAGYRGPASAMWNQSPGAVHTPGDTMEYRVRMPGGEWDVWLRYATDMAQWKQAGVSGRMTLQVDDGEPVSLENLPNTGSFGTYKWSRSAKLKVSTGEHTLRWRNVKGGGINLDAFVFSFDPAFEPSDKLWPKTAERILVLQGEDVTRYVSREGKLHGGAAAVWLAGDDAAISDLTISASPQVTLGVAIGSAEPLQTINGCRVERVRVADVEGKFGENCGVRVYNAAYASVRDSEIWGRSPLFLSGARQSQFTGNRLVSVTRHGGNAEAAILSRCEVLEECIIENNRIASPPGAEAGGPTARRLLWASTGRGSVTHNWIAGNGVELPAGPGAAVGANQARFGGVAGTDQNVGEMILFEANHRTMYFGLLAGADAQSVTLPRTVPATPDDRLGGVDRQKLGHDAAGNETPFWPPDSFDSSEEPPIGQYYVSVFSGAGQGQTRRVLRREGERLVLDQPWREPPAAGSLVAVGTACHQNLIVGNHTPDGMTGIQLWISCIENVVAGNTIARQRRQGVFLYANGTTLASSMPRTWNRGISPLFFNHVEGTRTDECSGGAVVTSGDSPSLPVEFPRALGNVLRHNSFVRSRGDGVTLTSRGPKADKSDKSASVLGTIVEFNVVRDALVGYHAAGGSDATVIRRNHAYFWYPVSNATTPLVGIQIDSPDAAAAIELNNIEGKSGGGEAGLKEINRGPAQPAGR